MEKVRKNLNKYVIGFLVVTITLFGGLSFFLDKGFIDRLNNYYVIFVSGLGILTLFFNNLEDFRWKNIKKIPFILTILTMIWLVLTFIFGIRRGIEGIKAIINFGCLLGLGFVISNIRLSKSDKKFILQSIFVSFGICMIVGIIQYFTGENLIQYSNALYPGIRGRINSTFFIATILDKYIVLVSVVLIYELWKHPKNHFYQLLYLLSGIGVSLTFSRGGQLVYIFLMAVYFIVSLFRKQLSNLIVVLVTFTVMFFIPGTTMSLQSGLNFVYDTLKLPAVIRVNVYDIYSKIDGTVKEWMSPSKNEKPSIEKPSTEKPDGSTETPSPSKPNNIFDDDNNHSLEYRDFYKKVASQFSKEHPIFGIGVGNYAYIVNGQNARDYLEDSSFFGWHTSYGYPHNNTAQTVAEVGMIGFVLITMTILSYICYLNFKNEMLYVFSVLLFVAALYLAGYTEGVYYSKQYIFVFMLIYAFLCAKTKEEKEVESVVVELFDKTEKVTKKDYIKKLSSHLKKGEKQFVVTANPEAFMIAEKDEDYRKMLLDEQTEIVADGIGLIKAGKILGRVFPERIPGVEIAEELLGVANKNGLSVYLFGSSEEVMEKMKELVATKYKNIKLVGAQNGYVKDKNAVFQDMKKKKPDLVLVALGMPLQEKLIYQNLDLFQKGVFIGVGGSFDVLSGAKKRAPKFFIKCNLEWLYRIIKEPKRIKRFYQNNVKFLFKVKSLVDEESQSYDRNIKKA